MTPAAQLPPAESLSLSLVEKAAPLWYDRSFPALPVRSYDNEVTSDFETNFKAMIKRIDDYAKDGRPEAV